MVSRERTPSFFHAGNQRFFQIRAVARAGRVRNGKIPLAGIVGKGFIKLSFCRIGPVIQFRCLLGRHGKNCRYSQAQRCLQYRFLRVSAPQVGI